MNRKDPSRELHLRNEGLVPRKYGRQIVRRTLFIISRDSGGSCQCLINGPSWLTTPAQHLSILLKIWFSECSDTTTTVHVFDVLCSQAIFEVWKNYAPRTGQMTKIS